jgi:hypothetical protein
MNDRRWEITVISDWNFCAGSDATQMGSAQYDFETLMSCPGGLVVNPLA